MLLKHDGDEEEATRSLLDRKEKQLDSIMFLGHAKLNKIVQNIERALTRGPMDAFVRRT
jgi:hypothetical protein